MNKFESIYKNKPIPKGAEEILEKMIEEREMVLFAIVGDLSKVGRYCETALFFTDKRVVVYDGVPGESKSYLFSDMQDVEAKRMYGNATLSAVMPNGNREIFFRYT